MATIHPDRAASVRDRRTRPGRSVEPASVEQSTGEPSVGELVGEISKDVSRLVQEEIQLAKAEMKEEATKAGKASGMLAGAGYAGHFVLLLGSLTVVFALANVMDWAWAALIVTAVWAVVGSVLFVRGRKQMRKVNLKPEQTVETLKEDARWVRNPTS
ncbi:phage holin family protein [Streptomyces sp. NPDC048389]|uniref:phage holin family protein n=1 Tax=Streptomyces sp. NPDC048389 TaxID=3154622 RepID=UPI003454302A